MTVTGIHTFQIGNNQLAYRKFGNGIKPLIAFHGFGQDSQVFAPLEKTLGGQFTIYAIDLFFHGNSHYSESKLLTKKDWAEILIAFLEKQGVNRFSLLGFSLGGRVALSSIEALANRLDQLILIAPDGITRSFWYRLATGSSVGRRLFRYVMDHLSLLNGVGHILTQFGLLNRTVMRFVEISLATTEQRDLVYATWTQLRQIQPDLIKISDLLNRNKVSVRFFTGQFDRLVPGFYILPLTRKLQYYELTVLKTGHNRLVELVGEQFMQIRD
jgi:pimeloyl-ACP methyl ester carboxylesterase